MTSRGNSANDTISDKRTMGSCFNLLSSSRFYEFFMTVPTDRSNSGRVAPLPKHPWVMRMNWSELLFAHWPVDPDAEAALLPMADAGYAGLASLGWCRFF